MYGTYLVHNDTKMSGCFEDKRGLNFMKFLRCVTGLWLPYVHNHKKEDIPVKKKEIKKEDLFITRILWSNICIVISKKIN